MLICMQASLRIIYVVYLIRSMSISMQPTTSKFTQPAASKLTPATLTAIPSAAQVRACDATHVAPDSTFPSAKDIRNHGSSEHIIGPATLCHKLNLMTNSTTVPGPEPAI